MDENKIRQIAREEASRTAALSRFSINSIPFHTHNGTDSNPISSPTIVYAGNVAYIDTFVGSGQFYLPTGWTVVQTDTGVYTVTHNLGTLLYSCTASAVQSTNQIVSHIITPLANEVTFSWFESNAAFTRLDTSFSFVLVQINNRAPAVKYTIKTN